MRNTTQFLKGSFVQVLVFMFYLKDDISSNRIPSSMIPRQYYYREKMSPTVSLTNNISLNTLEVHGGLHSICVQTRLTSFNLGVLV